jgi:hypothetical protein
VIEITVDLTRFRRLMRQYTDLDRVMAQIMPAQMALVQMTWQAAVSGAQLPGMTGGVSDDAYAAALGSPQSLQYPYNGDPFQGRIVMANRRLGERYEEGSGRYDMKPGLLGGPKSKIGKHGQRYNTVPFTHGAPGGRGRGAVGPPMPPAIYALARGLSHGESLKLPPRLTQLGIKTSSAGYRWKVSPFQGITKTGTSGKPTYMSFRRVSEPWFDEDGKRHGSAPNSWIHPGIKANPIVRSVINSVSPQIKANVQAMIMDAVKNDQT